MAQTVRDVLARYDVSLTEDDVAATLERALKTLPTPTAVPLTATEVSYLAAHAGANTAETIGHWDPLTESQEHAASTAGAVSTLLGATLGIDDLARRLGVDRSRISHRISAGTLHSFTSGRSRRRIPAWQVGSDGLLPGLEHVVRAIPSHAHPLDVAALMTTPQSELAGRTPVEHLDGGGDPAPVTELLEALGTW